MRITRPTLEQKKIMTKNGLNWHTWNVADEDNISLTLVSKKTGRRKVILK